MGRPRPAESFLIGISVTTLLIDNYDSFTFNLFQLIATIQGEPPLVIPNDARVTDDLRHTVSRIVISPGPGRPNRSADFGICADAILNWDKPLLGVCLGFQGIAALFGGRIERAPEGMHGRLSRIRHRGTDLFEGIPQDFDAVRYHSLRIAEPLPDCLETLAHADDGALMALRHKRRPLWGVQYHPESICTEYGERLLRNFLAQTATATRPPAIRTAPSRRAGQPPEPREVQPRSDAFQLAIHTLEAFPDPETAFVGLFGESATAFWLDSGLVKPGLARFSFMGDASGPHAQTVFYDQAEQCLTIQSRNRRGCLRTTLFDYLRRELAARQAQAPDLPFDFQGGFVGYLGYELKADCGYEGRWRTQTPDAGLILADRLIAFDHETGKAHLACLEMREHAARAQEWLAETAAQLKRLPPLPPLTFEGQDAPDFEWVRSPETHLAQIRACQELIADGESYEICLTNQAICTAKIDPLRYCRVLRRLNPAPFGAFLRFGDWAAVSSSPERFLRLDRDGALEAKPIKGTAPRTPADGDAHAADALRQSLKDRSEHLMIVDLLRNDLGKVCDIGSVAVEKLMDIESYATVHQMVSTVRGRLRPELDALDAVIAAFPGGSMTGAPKRRTLEIIDRLEGAARGVYSGAIGYFSCNGAMDLSMVIRTAIIEPGRVSIGSGGAVVALSEAQAELEEMALKALAPLQALAHGRKPTGVG